MGKQYTTAPILVNSNGDPIPQYLDITDKTDSPQGTFKPLTNETIQKVQLTGSKVILLKQFLGDNNGIGKNYYNYGSDTALSSNDVTPLDVSECKEKTIIIINNYDVQINIVINYYSTLSKTSFKRTPIDAISLASGSSIFLDKSKVPQLSAPIVGMGLSISGNPSSGSIDILFFGSRF